MLDLRSGPRGVLLASSLLVLALFAACSQGHRSPTEPDLATASSASALAPAAAASHGNGNGNGNGGNGGNGGSGGGSSALHLELQPDVWNTNGSHSNGTVSALITGSGLDKIDLTSIQLVGNASAAKPVPAVRASREGNHVRAFFRQSDAIGSLDHPKPGDSVTVMVKLTQGGQSQTLSDQVRIVGPNGGGGGEGGGDDSGLSAEIQPNHWNVNFAHTSGTVTALIEGKNLDQIDLKSIVLLGTDPAAKPLAATRADRQGNHVRAFFPQKDAFLTLLTPKPGQTVKVTIELKQADKTVDLTAKVQIVGPGR